MQNLSSVYWTHDMPEVTYYRPDIIGMKYGHFDNTSIASACCLFFYFFFISWNGRAFCFSWLTDVSSPSWFKVQCLFQESFLIQYRWFANEFYLYSFDLSILRSRFNSFLMSSFLYPSNSMHTFSVPRNLISAECILLISFFLRLHVTRLAQPVVL